MNQIRQYSASTAASVIHSTGFLDDAWYTGRVYSLSITGGLRVRRWSSSSHCYVAMWLLVRHGGRWMA